MDSLSGAIPGWCILAGLLGTSVVIALLVTSFVRRAPPLGGELKGSPAKGRPSVSASGSGTVHPNGPIDIYFGSQTGTAEGFAKLLGKEAAKYGFEGRVVDLEDFDPDRLQSSSLAVFLLATYGEGDPTDNAMTFHKWIEDSDGLLSNQAVGGLKYAVFGLGSTQYEHYNKMGKYADQRLEELGGERILAVGLGDDAGSLEEDYEKWKEDLWPSVLAAASQLGRADPSTPMSVSASITETVETPELDFTLTYVPSTGGRVPSAKKLEDSKINSSTKYYFPNHHADVRVAVNRELRTPKDGGSTKHIELDLQGSGLTYLTADNLAVLPENDSSVVEALARSQGYELDAVFEISAAKAPFPTPCSVREALTRYLDLKGIPRRSTLSQLASFAQDAAQRERLQRLASKAGREEYQEFVCKGGRSLADLITSSFPSLAIPLEHFVALAPHLQPRYYTISSSSSVHPSRIHVTVAVTEDRLADGRVHKGVCSTYLAGLKEGAAVRVFVRPSTFRLPADPSTPVIMVGPGTGIAPMRAMLQERKHQRVVEGRAVGASHLFFGCRRRDTDFLYQDELTAYEADGTLAKLHLAFSREAASKVYVQHVMAKPEAAALLWCLLKDEDAHVYVCGATTMGHDVHTAFVDIAVSQGKQSQEQAAAWVKGLQDRSRYVCELW